MNSLKYLTINLLYFDKYEGVRCKLEDIVLKDNYLGLQDTESAEDFYEIYGGLELKTKEKIFFQSYAVYDLVSVVWFLINILDSEDSKLYLGSNSYLHGEIESNMIYVSYINDSESNVKVSRNSYLFSRYEVDYDLWVRESIIALEEYFSLLSAISLKKQYSIKNTGLDKLIDSWKKVKVRWNNKSSSYE